MGVLDHMLGSVDESVARQFDDTPGGGFADETVAFVDPTRQASPETEQDVRAFLRQTSPYGVSPTQTAENFVLLSDVADVRGDNPPPQFGTSDPLKTPEGDGEVFSGAGPVEFVSHDVEAVISNVPGFDLVGGLPWWVGPAGVVAVAALLAVAFGQLFDVQVGG